MKFGTNWVIHVNTKLGTRRLSVTARKKTYTNLRRNVLRQVQFITKNARRSQSRTNLLILT